MLEDILKLYTMTMATGVTSPLPHLFGPPGCGKSTVAQQLADLVERKLHIINVSRISPLELEGVQMPVPHEAGTAGEQLKLKLLHATFWTQLEEGDILLLDEFLRGFPEVYNGLLDIITSRQVGGLELPRVFIMAASNSIVTYDKALEDRLHHMPVPDPRKSKRAAKKLRELIVDELGLLPEMTNSIEMERLIDTEVLPMYEVLDSLKNRSSSPATLKGRSIRHLIGLAKLRDVTVPALSELLSMNNQRALREGKPQYVFLFDKTSIKAVGQAYEAKSKGLIGNEKLTPVMRQNLELNLQLLELESIRHERGTTADDDDDAFTNDPPF